jgi:hypothetical protein
LLLHQLQYRKLEPNQSLKYQATLSQQKQLKFTFLRHRKQLSRTISLK